MRRPLRRHDSCLPSDSRWAARSNSSRLWGRTMQSLVQENSTHQELLLGAVVREDGGTQERLLLGRMVLSTTREILLRLLPPPLLALHFWNGMRVSLMSMIFNLSKGEILLLALTQC